MKGEWLGMTFTQLTGISLTVHSNCSIPPQTSLEFLKIHRTHPQTLVNGMPGQVAANTGPDLYEAWTARDARCLLRVG